MPPVLSTDMKEQNRRLVYRYIHDKPGQTVTRTEVSRATGISGPTVLKIFGFLEAQGFVVSDGPADTLEPGRKSSVFRFVPDAACALGVSYDGHFLDVELVNLNLETVRQKRLALCTDIPALLGDVLPAQLPGVVRGVRLMGAGISLPAIVDNKKRRIRHPAFPAEGEEPARACVAEACARLEQTLGAPVLLENDVNCAALAEFRRRELGGREDLVYLFLGGGIGAGLVLSGKLRRGSHFACGEIGYLSWDTAASVRTGAGCLETELYRAVQTRFGVDLRAEDGVAVPDEAVDFAAQQLALAVANLSNALDVSRFVVGGRAANRMGRRLIDGINARLPQLCIHDAAVSASECPNACAMGAASQLIVRELDSLFSDR